MSIYGNKGRDSIRWGRGGPSRVSPTTTSLTLDRIPASKPREEDDEEEKTGKLTDITQGVAERGRAPIARLAMMNQALESSINAAIERCASSHSSAGSSAEGGPVAV